MLGYISKVVFCISIQRLNTGINRLTDHDQQSNKASKFVIAGALKSTLTGGSNTGDTKQKDNKKHPTKLTQWGEEQEAAFNHLKQMLISPPILRRPDFEQPFLLYTDWSTKAVGAILAQKDPSDPKGEYVIAYASRKLNSAEQNYSATEGECLAVIWAVKYFRPYLWNTRDPFTLVTDHSALQWLHKNRDISGRLTRWSLRLQEYNFKIVYRKGTAHANVDCLTRMPAPDYVELAQEAEDMDCYMYECESEAAEDTDRYTYECDSEGAGGVEYCLMDICDLEDPTHIEAEEPSTPPPSPLTAGITPAGNQPLVQSIAIPEQQGSATEDATESNNTASETITLTGDGTLLPSPIKSFIPTLLAEQPKTQDLTTADGEKSRDASDTEPIPFSDTIETDDTAITTNDHRDLERPSSPGQPIGPWVDAILGPNGLSNLPADLGYTFLISIEGNTASGKSTLLRMAEPMLLQCGYDVAYEPVEAFPQLLQAFYENPKQYALALQSLIIRSYFSLLRHSGALIIIVERSPLSSLQVFAKNLLDQGILGAADYALLRVIFRRYGWYPDAMVYLKTPAATCHQRLQQRAKGPDLDISGEYLQQLEYRHEQMIRYSTPKFSMTLDGTNSMAENLKELLQFVDSSVRMGVYGVAPTPVPLRRIDHTTWCSQSATFGEACTIEAEEKGPTQKQQLQRPVDFRKDDSDTSTDPEVDYIPCKICGQADNWAQLLLCDGCDAGYHMKCLTPPLFRIPEQAWLCPSCRLTKMNTGSEPDQAADAIEDTKVPDILNDELVMNILKERHGKGDPVTRPDTTEPEDWRRTYKRAQKRANGYFINQGSIYKASTKQHPQPRRVPAAEERPQLIAEVHDLAHFGVTKCATLLSKKFYWYNMFKEVSQYIRNCEPCKRKKAKFITYPELQSIEPAGLFTTVAIDTMGAFPESSSGNKYLVMCVELYSRWVEARAIPDQKSATVAKFFKEEILARHGCPKECISDNGSEFKGEINTRVPAHQFKKPETPNAP